MRSVTSNVSAIGRVMEPTEPGRPFYVFILLSPTLRGLSQDEYRAFRRNFLDGYCDVVKFRHPEAEDIVGVATEPSDEAGSSQDVVYRDARVFTEEDQANAQWFADDYEIMANVVRSVHTEYVYPDP